MSADLNIWAIHSMSFDTVKSGILQIEKKLGKPLKHLNSKDQNTVERTSELKEVEFYTDFDILEHNFNNWKSIEIRTNFSYCPKMKITPSAIQFGPIGFYIRFNKWIELVNGDFDKHADKEVVKMNAMRLKWVAFHEYTKLITTQLGGDTIIFLDDNRFQKQEDILYGGGNFIDFIAELNKKDSPLELETFADLKNSNKIKYTWYYNKLV